MGRYRQAFECFSEANSGLSKTRIAKKYQKQKFIQKIQRIKQTLTAHTWEETVSTVTGHATGEPVFLMGFPRSGTTLLDQILASHPRIDTLEEKPVLHAAIERLKVHGLRYPEDLHGMNADILNDVRRTYVQNASNYLEHAPDIKIIDKLPLHIVNAGFIHKVFPKSKFILAVRHPVDVCLSCFFQNFKLNDAMIHFTDIQDTARLYGMVMDLWHNYTNSLSLDYHVIRYEDLVTNFDEETKRLIQYIGISWDPSVREYFKHAESRRKIATPSYHQVIEPIYKRSMYRWKNYRKQLEPIFDLLIPYVNRFGYTLDGIWRNKWNFQPSTRRRSTRIKGF
jgi:hypothetical protein